MLAASIAGTGCQALMGSGARFGAEAQIYDFGNVSNDVVNPRVRDRVGGGLSFGKEFRVLEDDSSVQLQFGADARVNLNTLYDDDPIEIEDDCEDFGSVTTIAQSPVTLIPFVGGGIDLGGARLQVEVGFPYTKWEFDHGQDFSPGCFFDPALSSNEWVWGRKLRTGILFPGSEGTWGIFFTHESYDLDLVDVDAWGLELAGRL